MFDFLHRRHKAPSSSSPPPPSTFAEKVEEEQQAAGANEGTTINTASCRASVGPDDDNGIRQVHTQNLANSTRCLLQSVPLPSVTWSLECSSWITEARTFYIISPSGEYLFLQVAYTDSGWPIKASCQVSASFFNPAQATDEVQGHAADWRTCPRLKRPRGKKDPQRGSDGHVTETVNHHGNKLNISDSRTALKIAGTEVRLSGGTCKGDRFAAPSSVLGDETSNKIDKDKSVSGDSHQDRYHFRLLCEGTILSLDLTLECDCQALSFGDGNIHFGVEADEGTIHMKFVPGLRAQGTIVVDGVSRPYFGHAFSVHQIQGVRPTQVATRWNCFLFIADNDDKKDVAASPKKPDAIAKGSHAVQQQSGLQTSLFMLQLCTPSSYGSEVVNYGIFCERGRVEAVCIRGQVTTFAPSRDSQSGYYVPAEFRLEWHGMDAAGKGFEAYCQTKPTTLVDRINLLDLLPFMMRKIVETFVTRPYVYQWLDRAQVTLKRDGGKAEHQLQGWLLNELSILNED